MAQVSLAFSRQEGSKVSLDFLVGGTSCCRNLNQYSLSTNREEYWRVKIGLVEAHSSGQSGNITSLVHEPPKTWKINWGHHSMTRTENQQTPLEQEAVPCTVQHIDLPLCTLSESNSPPPFSHLQNRLHNSLVKRWTPKQEGFVLLVRKLTGAWGCEAFTNIMHYTSACTYTHHTYIYLTHTYIYII